jgi:hypothetical protein
MCILKYRSKDDASQRRKFVMSTLVISDLEFLDESCELEKIEGAGVGAAIGFIGGVGQYATGAFESAQFTGRGFIERGVTGALTGALGGAILNPTPLGVSLAG